MDDWFLIFFEQPEYGFHGYMMLVVCCELWAVSCELWAVSALREITAHAQTHTREVHTAHSSKLSDEIS